MSSFKSVVSLCAVAGLMACGGGVEGQGELSTQKSALVTGTSQGCTFTVSFVQRAPFPPPSYDIKLTREASATCPWPASTVTVGLSNANPPTMVSLAANDLGVAVGYTYRTGGPSPLAVAIKHVAPDTMAIVRSTGLTPISLGTYIWSADLAIGPDGTTLIATGTKNVPISGETGSGDHYVAVFPNFFTSTLAPTIVAY
ncbi:hypothetical protein COCOR_04466 [Corallococcus coralloides DSM 2259]|uniref:Lipoprotein n=1 Tax=Corallococcus coralloides (strain ATCC 25202 / DSM 2259 / NBRC 100086 / M2) TaxID=1144275 RepID=H8MFE5_CORCM|nr:hypothetical protein [Corallococcus coralloides]AFE05852.1 hypothetical protein COCOR_04466 [Corallococcus coralloides DSM 2259]